MKALDLRELAREDLGKAVAESPVGGVLTFVGERKHGQMLLARNRRDVQRVPDHFPSQGRDRQQGGNDHGHGRRQHDRGPKRAAQPRRKTAPTPARLVGRQIPEGSCGCEAQRPWDILQVGDELRSGLIARRGVLREAARDRCEELRREVRPQLGERAKFVVDDGVEGRSVGAPAERQPAGDHLVDHNAERPEVGAAVGHEAAGLLRRHVGCGTAALPAQGQARVPGERGEPEVHDLDQAVTGQHQVARLDVAVDDAVAVGLTEPDGNLDGDGEGLLNGQRSACEPRPQRLAVHVGHADEDLATGGLVDLVDCAYVGVVDRARGLRLVREALARGRVAGELRRQELEGDEALEARVFGLVDDSHPAATEPLEHPVVRDCHADHASRPPSSRGPWTIVIRAWFVELVLCLHIAQLERFVKFGQILAGVRPFLAGTRLCAR